MVTDDTIVARATPFGSGGVGIVRLSGANAAAIVGSFLRLPGDRSVCDVPPRYMETAAVIDADTVLDRCLVVRFEGPRSFTGEDVVELHLHGNMLIVDEVIRLAVSHGARPADPGEFTRRAFLNGKLDLTQVEGLAEVISAESQQAVHLAQRQLHGDLRRRLDAFRDRTISVLARLELELDFVEEGYEFASSSEVAALVGELRSFAADLLAGLESGVRLRRGPRILLLGRPNAGKSSLFNALVGYSRAIVSPVAGTTRDYIEERITHGGLVFHIVDTAGLRSTSDSIESAGIARAEDLSVVSDMILYLIDSRSEDLDEERRMVDDLARRTGVAVTPVLTKMDLVHMVWSGRIHTSVHDPASIRALLDHLVASYAVDTTERIALINERQASLLQRIVDILDAIPGPEELPTELLSTELRALLQPLSELTGATVNEHILNSIFSSFCIGK